MRSYTVRINGKDVKRIYAGTTRVAGMDIDVYTESGRLPLWSGAPDPGNAVVTGTKSASKNGDTHAGNRTVPFYMITDAGRDAMSQYDSSVPDEMYKNIMRVMSVISDGTNRQVDISRQLELDQRKVWYIIGKIKKLGLINEIDGVV